MLGEESKRKQSFSFPQDLSEDGGNVLMQLMELPDKHERQVITSALAANVTKPLRFLETIAEKRSEKEEQIAENVSVLLE
ncbi:MAG: hypothetical protein IKV55_02720 [Oscillospiraceae bacterium]|nr:hypothetical protein [Oscillospiraceae bacterium]